MYNSHPRMARDKLGGIMNVVELRELLNTLGLDDNGKICVLIGRTADGEYEIVQVDENGKVVISGG